MERSLLEIKLCGSVPDDVCGSALGFDTHKYCFILFSTTSALGKTNN